MRGAWSLDRVELFDAGAEPGVGELILTRLHNYLELRDELVVNHADPKVLITSEVLDQLEWCDPRLASWDVESRALTVKGANRTVIYRITWKYDMRRDCWLAVWPD